MRRLAVLISGTGTNLSNLVEKCRADLKKKAEISLVISNKEGVAGLEVAKNLGIKTVIIPDSGPKFSLSDEKVLEYNDFIKEKQKAQKSFSKISFALSELKAKAAFANSKSNIFKLNYEYSLQKLMEEALDKISTMSYFIEEDIKEKVLQEVFYNALVVEEVQVTKNEEEEIFNYIDNILYEYIDEIRDISNLFIMIRENPAFLRFFEREKYDLSLHRVLIEEKIDYILLAGFMRILSPSFVGWWKNKIINIHPSLLPSFKGAHAVRQALEYGARVTGCTVHFVSEGVDEGKIIGQAAVEIKPEDTLETLHNRIKAAEKTLYPSVLEELLKSK